MKTRGAEVRQLQAFSILAQELHFGRAAGRLAITQPALSQLLRDLEARVGVPLIERTTRHVALSVAGAAFLEEAQDILLRLDRAVERARDAAGYQGEVLRVGAGLQSAFTFLPGVLKQYRRRYPSIGIEVEILHTSEIVRALEQRSLHVGLLRPPKEIGLLHLKPLYTEPFLAAMPEDHPLATKEPLMIEDLAGAVLLRVFRPDLKEAFNDLDEEMTTAGIQLERCTTVQSTFNALALVSANRGISLVPAWVCTIPWSGLVFRHVVDLKSSIGLSVAWRSDRKENAVFNFVEAAARMASRQAG